MQEKKCIAFTSLYIAMLESRKGYEVGTHTHHDLLLNVKQSHAKYTFCSGPASNDKIAERRHLEAKTNGWAEIASRIANFVSKQQSKESQRDYG
jgi:hypothetical protein